MFRPVPFIVLILGLAVQSAASAQSITISIPAPAAPTATPVAAAPVSPGVAPAAERNVQLSLQDVRQLAKRTQTALRNVVLRGALDPAITGRAAAPTHSIALEVGKEGDTVGKARLAFPLDYGSSVDLVLQGPINKQSSGVPLTDRGLASGASATLGYSLTLWGQTIPASTVSASPALARVAQSARSGQSPVSLTPLETLIATGIGLRDDPEPSLFADSLVQAMSSLKSDFQAQNALAIADALWDRGTARLSRTLLLRGSYGVGANTFKVAEALDPLKETSSSKRDQSKAVSVAYLQLLEDGDAQAPLMLLSAGYSWSEAWKGGTARQICTPYGAGPATECRSLTLDGPTLKSAEGWEIDLRSWAYTQKLGVNPHFSYDRTTRKWSSEVGLSYLVLKDAVNGLPQLDTKALTVGMRVGSRPADDGGFYASIYFGTVLSK